MQFTECAVSGLIILKIYGQTIEICAERVKAEVYCITSEFLIIGERHYEPLLRSHISLTLLKRYSKFAVYCHTKYSLIQTANLGLIWCELTGHISSVWQIRFGIGPITRHSKDHTGVIVHL